MTFIGKLLVMLTVVMGLSFLTWGMVVFTQHVDFAAPKDGGGTAPAAKGAGGAAAKGGKINELNARIQELDDANTRAIKRWVANYATINELETDRFNRRNFYQSRLEIAQTGKLNGVNVQGPMREIKFDDTTGLIEMDLEVEPATMKLVVGDTFLTKRAVIVGRGGLPAQSPDTYFATIDSTNQKIMDTQKQIVANIKRHQDATTIINGTKEPPVKGLRQLIREQIDIEVIAKEERETLSDYITNRRAEAQLFVKRRDSLKARIDELLRIRGTLPDLKME